VTPKTRKQFLGASAAGAVGLLAARCSIGGGGSDVRLGHLGGDAWTWDKQVTGSTGGCKDLRLETGGRSVRARIAGDRFQGSVRLRPGSNRVTAVCDEGGSDTVTYDERLEERPTAQIHVSVAGRTIILDGTASQPMAPDGSAITSYAWSAASGNPEALDLGDASNEDVRLTAPEKDGEYYVALTVKDAKGRTDTAKTYFAVERGTPRAVDLMHENPAWVESAVVYGVIPFLFGEHPLPAVTAKLDYLKKLGVNALWLSPIFRSPDGDFGYAVVDYFSVNPSYGTKEDVRKLVEAAHERGIRVLLDFIPNHSSDQHPYFKDTVAHGKRSNYWTFYDRDASGAPTHYFDWSNLPNFNYSNPEMERFILEAFSYWVREYDVDGFRVDACWGVQRRKPDFWPRWRMEMKRIKPDMLLLAEATARDPYWFQHGFDVAYDWTEQLGEWAWSDVFYDTESLSASLESALTNGGRGYYPDALIFRFLNNNDTGIRFVSQYDSDTTRVAATLLLTLPGVPCVYTGDEVGAQYLPYSDRSPITWEDIYNLRPWYDRLIHLRTSTPSLHSRQWDPVTIGPENSGLFAYVRYARDGGQPLLVVLNFARDTFDARLELPARARAIAGASTLSDLLGGTPVSHGGGSALRVKMDALSARILEPA
jgi:cyclomaltodextrinase / maltogenic alpha-amylase / neopullulanase